MSELIPVAAALIAAVDVFRGERVPRGFRAMPLVAVGLCVVPPVIFQVLLVPGAFSSGVALGLLPTLSELATLCRLVALVGLGVMAIVVAQRSPGGVAVPVYSSSDEAP
ncbi:hypothetical protein ET475_12180 [Microbacterium protaetiae]|uniref:Uncharacterized protein n=1 Tax=Microbacterium protaetiae TaxID=2509458 RepID=A0A4P6EKJ3_9MICO|nr:hypothetical protein ET475_12180 [Microbacterium protaetiae]